VAEIGFSKMGWEQQINQYTGNSGLFQSSIIFLQQNRERFQKDTTSEKHNGGSSRGASCPSGAAGAGAVMCCPRCPPRLPLAGCTEPQAAPRPGGKAGILMELQ